jgi:RimJ/RimL family protein N-acetyltransferase
MALEGKTVLIREERESDMQFLVDLRNDLDTQGFTKSLPTDYTLPMYRKRFENTEFSYQRDDARFILEDKESGDLAGLISYYSMQSRLSVVIGIVVAKQFWGTGLAFDAQETLVRFVFEELGVRVVRLYTNSGNPAAMKLAERSGFKVCTRMREAVFRRGELFDNVVMELLREDFYTSHPKLEDNLPKI